MLTMHNTMDYTNKDVYIYDTIFRLNFLVGDFWGKIVNKMLTDVNKPVNKKIPRQKITKFYRHVFKNIFFRTTP